jgi:hypothetical protein
MTTTVTFDVVHHQFPCCMFKQDCKTIIISHIYIVEHKKDYTLEIHFLLEQLNYGMA